MIEVSNLSYSYNESATISFPDFTIKKGEHCLLLGESGSGKTTLLHLMGGLLRGYTGQLRVDNKDLHTFSESTLDKFRGQKIGFIFQKNHLVQALNVEKNLMLAPYLAGKKFDEVRVANILTALDLSSKRRANVAKLSQGQAQRVAIARAVLNKPSFILADEPTSALDDRNCDNVINLLLNVASENGTTLIIATHDQRLKQKIAKQININY